jgi:hypothetical protein
MTMIRSAFVACLLMGLLLAVMPAQAQKKGPKSLAPLALPKTDGLLSRGSGNHNRSNMGSAFENRGKLYPHQISLGPTFEWPIKSQHEYVYRANPYVGIPGNMIQGRFTTDEEWEAAAGYNNPDSVQVAMSDKPYTWPRTGWPVKRDLRVQPGQLLRVQRFHEQQAGPRYPGQPDRLRLRREGHPRHGHVPLRHYQQVAKHLRQSDVRHVR